MRASSIFLVVLLGFAGLELAASPPTAVAGDKPASLPAKLNPETLPPGAVTRLGSGRLRIGNAAFALTPDGRAIVTVSPEGVVQRFDARTGRLLERQQIRVRGDAASVGPAFAQLSDDGRVVMIEECDDSRHSRLTIWDVVSGKRIFRADSTMMLIGQGTLSPDGKQFAFGAHTFGDGPNDQLLRIVDLKSGRMRDIRSREYYTSCIRFSADGKRLAAFQTNPLEDRSAQVACFDVASGQELWRLPAEGGWKFAFSPDGKAVVSAGMNKRRDWGFFIVEVDSHSGKPAASFTRDLCADPNSPLLIAPDLNGSLLIAPDNRTVVMNRGGEIVLWDLRSRKEIRRFALPKTNGGGHGPELGGISPDSRTLITNLGYLQRWDLTTGKPFFAAPPNDSLGGPIDRLTFTPDGKEVVASSGSFRWGRWDVATGQLRSVRQTPYIDQLIRTPDGVRAVSFGVMLFILNPYDVTVTDPITGKPLSTIRWADPNKISISPTEKPACTLTANGKTQLVAHQGHLGATPASFYVTACDATSGRRLSRFAAPDFFRFRRPPFSPCGRWVVLGGKVYHVGTGTELFAPAGELGEELVPSDSLMHGPVWFSDDGRFLAGRLMKKKETPSVNDTLAVWELSSGAVLARYPKAGFLAQVAFAPDGRTLALLDWRGVRLEDMLTGQHLADYAAPDVTCDVSDRGSDTQTLAFAPDGRTLATGHTDGTVLLWKVPQPRAAAPPALKEAEREKLWTDLRSPSATRARAAVERLARRPGEAAALLKTRFRLPPAPDDAVLAALIKDLDSDVFATREEASRKLHTYGASAEAMLRRTLAKAPSLEMRRRIEGLLAETPSLRLPLSGDRLRGVRAIEVLERAGDSEARKLLQAWAEQTADVQLAAEARIALERLRSTPAMPKRNTP